MKLNLFLIITIVFPLYSQIPVTREFTLPQNDSLFNSKIVMLGNNSLASFWVDNNKLYFSRSSNYGIEWDTQINLLPAVSIINPGYYTVTITNSGRIIIIYRDNNVYLIYSDDNGNSFSSPQQLNITSGIFSTNYKFLKSNSGDLYFSYTKGSSSVYFIKSSDNGNSWSNEIFVRQNGINRGVIASPDNNLHAFYFASSIFKTISTDNGITWGPSTLIRPGDCDLTLAGNTLWMGYETSGLSDIIFQKSDDYGSFWQQQITYTKYPGIDRTVDLQVYQDKVLFSFSSGRAYSNAVSKFHRYFAILNVTEDLNTPPHHTSLFLIPPAGYNIEFIITTKVLDYEGIHSVFVIYNQNGETDSLQMINTSSDNYEVTVPGHDSAYYFIFNTLVNDVDGNSVLFKGDSILVTERWNETNAFFDVNRIKLPLEKAGVTGDVIVPPDFSGGIYDGKGFLFSGGFYLSGITNNEMWANAVASASRIQDYHPGPVNSDPEDSIHIVYTVHASDPPFGESWQKWITAVELGADFYDGNNDGFYTPVDLNGNQVWDLNEDRPDLIGDMIAWCVYNDGVPSNLRRFFDVQPQGIEIHQLVFANYPSNNQIENIIFIRCRIINKGTVASSMDSVYFSAWSDPDLGWVNDAYIDDLIGTDTLLQSVFVYNDGPDSDWGINPPSFFQQLTQGPVVYIPGETFIDNNSNGIYDPGIDTPLDSAKQNYGLFLGSEIFPGAKNHSLTSSMHYMSSHLELGDPNTKTEARNYMLGRMRNGDLMNPCSWNFGTVQGINCNHVNPIFIYSGDPVTNYGWINTFGTDQRMMANSGPFILKENEPIDIIVGYIIGRGYDHLNSITKARQNAAYAMDYYNTNFVYLPPVGVDEENEITLVNEFILYQNYPNPFNPATKIKFTIPSSAILSEAKDLSVTLKVYDILGREVATLVNEEKPAGTYEVEFNASSLASGVYFYKLQAGSFISTKKMIFVK